MVTRPNAPGIAFGVPDALQARGTPTSNLGPPTSNPESTEARKAWGTAEPLRILERHAPLPTPGRPKASKAWERPSKGRAWIGRARPDTSRRRGSSNPGNGRASSNAGNGRASSNAGNGRASSKRREGPSSNPVNGRASSNQGTSEPFDTSRRRAQLRTSDGRSGRRRRRPGQAA